MSQIEARLDFLLDCLEFEERKDYVRNYPVDGASVDFVFLECKHPWPFNCTHPHVTSLLAPGSSTVDSFQGKQRPVVVYCFTVTDPRTRALQDKRRLNVALTRAEEKLIIVGATQELSTDAFYGDLCCYFDAGGIRVPAPPPSLLSAEIRACSVFLGETRSGGKRRKPRKAS